MKRAILVAAAAALLTGCAGLKTGWVFQLRMQYVTPQQETPLESAKPA